jgi:hypothetical protein
MRTAVLVIAVSYWFGSNPIWAYGSQSDSGSSGAAECESILKVVFPAWAQQKLSFGVMQALLSMDQEERIEVQLQVPDGIRGKSRTQKKVRAMLEDFPQTPRARIESVSWAENVGSTYYVSLALKELPSFWRLLKMREVRGARFSDAALVRMANVLSAKHDGPEFSGRTEPEERVLDSENIRANAAWIRLSLELEPAADDLSRDDWVALTK